MPLTRIPLLTSSEGGAAIAAAPQRIYNLYPNATNSTKNPITWRGTPGWSLWWSNPTPHTLRALAEFKNQMFVIRGSSLLQFVGYTEEVVGTIGTSTGRVDMAQDGINLMISDGVGMYRWDGTTLSSVTLPTALTSPVGVIFHDGHFVCYNDDNGEFWISNKFDGSTWDALDFATAEDKPDDITGLQSDRVLWIFGEYTTQAYYNSGASFPFVPNPQGLMIYGMVGHTNAQLDNTTYWLARSKEGAMKAVKANGFAPQAISTSQLEEEWALFSTIDDAYANTIMWEGHEWYILTFPTEGRTFVYDSIGLWFEWGDYDSSTGTIINHPMVHHLYHKGENLFISDDGNIYKLDGAVFRHGDDVMLSGFKSFVIQADEERVFLSSAILDVRNGVGGEIAMRVSTDGGYSWEDWQSRSLGREGKHRYRTEFHRLGSGYEMVLEARITDEVPRVITSATLGVATQQTYLERRNSRVGIGATGG